MHTLDVQKVSPMSLSISAKKDAVAITEAPSAISSGTNTPQQVAGGFPHVMKDRGASDVAAGMNKTLGTPSKQQNSTVFKFFNEMPLAQRISHLDSLIELEQQAFPPDVAEKRQVYEFRLTSSPSTCMGIFQMEEQEAGNYSMELIGYICGTLSNQDYYSAELLKEENHDRKGKNVMIHAFVINPKHQGNGIGKKSFLHYLKHFQKVQLPLHSFALVCKPNLIGFYEKLGFHVTNRLVQLGNSSDWHELQKPVEQKHKKFVDLKVSIPRAENLLFDEKKQLLHSPAEIKSAMPLPASTLDYVHEALLPKTP